MVKKPEVRKVLGYDWMSSDQNQVKSFSSDYRLFVKGDAITWASEYAKQQKDSATIWRIEAVLVKTIKRGRK